MKCRLDSTNLKIWSRIITTLTSIGDDEVHFSFTDSTLTLTVFNGTLSVSGTCTFFANFFQLFSVPRGHCKTFKLPVKCLMKPFRSMKFVSKSCMFCEIEFEDDRDTVIFAIGCKSKTQIRYTINMMENLVEMSADYNSEGLVNWIRAEPKFMNSNLSHFTHGKGLVDLTLKAEGNKVLLKNCATDLLRKEGKIYTELCLSTMAFDRFTINEDSEVTFQLRDFKSFVALAEHIKVPMTLHFHRGLDPVILIVKNEQLEATLMLAPKYVEQVGDTQESANASGVISPASASSSAVAVPITKPPPVVRMRDTPVIVPETPFVTPSQKTPGIPVPETPDSRVPESIDSRVSESPDTAIPSTSSNNLNATRTLKKRQKKRKPSMTNDEIEDQENSDEQRRIKRFRSILAILKPKEPYDIYKRFPGHDIVLVPPSDDEDDEPT